MKSIFLVFLMLALLTNLTACGAAGKTQQGAASSEETVSGIR